MSSRGRLKWAVHGVGSAATYETELSHATVPQHHLLCSRVVNSLQEINRWCSVKPWGFEAEMVGWRWGFGGHRLHTSEGAWLAPQTASIAPVVLVLISFP